MIDSKIAKDIGVKGPTEPLELICLGDLEVTDSLSQRIKFGISGIDGTRVFDIIRGRTINNLILPSQSLLEKEIKRYPHIAKLPIDPYIDIRPKVLIGQDHWDLITPMRVHYNTTNLPAASLTKLGWVIHGRLPTSVGNDHTMTIMGRTEEKSNLTTEDDLYKMVKNSYSLDGLGITNYNRKNQMEQRAEEILFNTSRQIENGWEVGLIWNRDLINMPDNRKDALNRLRALERKMDRDPKYAQTYCNQMKHFIDSKYCRKIDLSEAAPKQRWYLPHFGALNINKPEKVRIVFDASARCAGISLNDNLLTGPDMVSSLLGVLFRFRQKCIAFTADIREMFLQIKIREEDQWAQRFLWRGMDRAKPVEDYVMTSMIFGSSCSPCAANYVMNRNASEFKKEFPQAVQAIRTKHYVDDYLDSVDSIQEGIERIKEVVMIHKKGGFEIRGWASNDSDLLKNLPSELQNQDDIDSIKASQDVKKTLGIQWQRSSDNLRINLDLKKIPQEIVNGMRIPTKREVLSIVMAVYDPIGIVLPLTIRSRIMMQNICRSRIRWDDKLENEQVREWFQWINELQESEKYQISRSHFRETAQPETIELHVYCDASERAYSAVAYFRGIYRDGKIQLSLVAGKARVAPLKPMSIPRLELQGALIACRLRKTIIQEYELEINKTFMWTDSQTVLCWIKSDPVRYQTFVANRLGEIDELSHKEEWMWVPSKKNPADSATRSSGDVENHMNKWLKGPEYLLLKESRWPEQPNLEKERSPKNELKRVFAGVTNAQLPTELPDINRISKFLCLKRSTALLLLSIDRWKGNKKSVITPELLERAEKLLIKRVQNEDFGREIKSIAKGDGVVKNSRICLLSPMIDSDGILKIDGRINAVKGVPSTMKNPIILDGRHRYTRMMIQHYHERMGHGAPETVINEIRQRYWILRLRPTLSSISAKCQWCKKQRTKPAIPRMGELPSARLEHHQRPFTFCGVDYFGPMFVTVGRRKEKRWGVLFTCLTTRAIHIELAATMNTSSTVMSLRRMMSRRGNPSEIYSDNGTNLVGANSELQNALQAIDNKKIVSEMTNLGIKWRFIPPLTPHMGGSWERLVRSVKIALAATLNERAPREEVLLTLLVEAEHVVNSRPLTHVSMDHRDSEALTPNHFLIGSSSGVTVPGRFTDDDLWSRKHWRKSQRLADMFWSRWVKEYLPSLVIRKRWTQEARPLSAGDVVLVADSTLPRNTWPKGIITTTYPGKDGRVRIVDVQVRGKILKRSAAKLVVLVPKDE